MSSLKLKHSGGNSVSLNPPTTAPTSSDVAFKLPNADGSAGQVLQTDGSGNLSWVTQTLPMVDMWRMTTSTAAGVGSGATITNWIQPSDTYSSPGRIGSSMSESNGIWTFPQTGIYNVTATFTLIIGASDDALAQVRMYVTDNGGTNYHNVALWRAGSLDNSIHHTVTNNYVIDVTNTSNVKFYFDHGSFSANSYVGGNATYNISSMTVIRLGDT